MTSRNIIVIDFLDRHAVDLTHDEFIAYQGEASDHGLSSVAEFMKEATLECVREDKIIDFTSRPAESSQKKIPLAELIKRARRAHIARALRPHEARRVGLIIDFPSLLW